MLVPITFLPVATDDLSDEPLIIEAEVEGYLVKRVFVDEGASLEVMYEHCFNNLCPSIKSRLQECDSPLMGFSGEVVRPLGKIELDVCFGDHGLFRKARMKFAIIRSSSPYNIILGRTGLRELRAIPSTIHAMMKFPTPKGIATLVTRSVAMMECRVREEKQLSLKGEKVKTVEETRREGRNKVGLTEEVLINPAYPDQLVTIGGNFSDEYRRRLIDLLRRNKDVFAWQPKDMTGVPRFIEQHSLNVKSEDTPVAQKRRTFSQEKNIIITKEVQKWLKAGIVRPVRYPTWISNPVLVKKCDGSWRMCKDFKNLNSSCPKD